MMSAIPLEISKDSELSKAAELSKTTMDTVSTSPLFTVLWSDDVSGALQLIDVATTNLNERGENDITPLILAVQRILPEVVKKLAKNNVDVNLVDNLNCTALQLALDLYLFPETAQALNPNKIIDPKDLLEMVYTLLSCKNIHESITLLKSNADTEVAKLADEALSILASTDHKIFLSLQDFREKTKHLKKTAMLKGDEFALAITQDHFAAFKTFIDNDEHLRINLSTCQAVEEEFGDKYKGKPISYLQMLVILNREEMFRYLLSKPQFNSQIKSTIVKLAELMGEAATISLFKKLAPHWFKRTKQREITGQYLKLAFEIWKEYQIAKKAGKKLLIVIGENHRSGYSFNLKNMILDICRQLGIDKFMVELDGERIKGFLSAKSEFQPRPFRATDRISFNSMTMSLNHALSKGMNILPIDWVRFTPKDQLFLSFGFEDSEMGGVNQKREKMMADLIAQANDHGVVQIGFAHMSFIIQTLQALKQFHIVPFSVIPGTYDLDEDQTCDLSFDVSKLSCKIGKLHEPKLAGNFFMYDSNAAETALKKITRAGLKLPGNLGVNANKKGEVLLPVINPEMLWLRNVQKEQFALDTYVSQAKKRTKKTKASIKIVYDK